MRQEVLPLGSDRVREVVDVLCEAFHDYPVMRFVLGPEPAYGGRLRTLIDFFVMTRVLRGEPLLGVGVSGALTGTAIVSRPADPTQPTELLERRDHVWRALGGEARSRYRAYSTGSAFALAEPHLHLNMVGVRRSEQGTGLGRALIERVHHMSREDPESTGVSLTTENPHNVALYEHLGYEIIGRSEVSPELTTWGFFRPD